MHVVFASDDFCAVEMRLDTVEAAAEHGVILQGSSKRFAQSETEQISHAQSGIVGRKGAYKL